MLPHAERTPWVPSKYAEGERRWGKHVRKGENLIKVAHHKLYIEDELNCTYGAISLAPAQISRTLCVHLTAATPQYNCRFRGNSLPETATKKHALACFFSLFADYLFSSPFSTTSPLSALSQTVSSTFSSTFTSSVAGASGAVSGAGAATFSRT